jgi:UDP-N-acetylglucosamine 2-epimerase
MLSHCTFSAHKLGSFEQQIAAILAHSEEIMLIEKPDKFLVLGDTNSELAAFVAKRLGIPRDFDTYEAI